MFPWLVHLENLCACTLSVDKSPDGKSDLPRDRFKSYGCIYLFTHTDNKKQITSTKMCKRILVNEQTNNKLYTSKEYVNAKQIMLSRCVAIKYA